MYILLKMIDKDATLKFQNSVRYSEISAPNFNQYLNSIV